MPVQSTLAAHTVVLSANVFQDHMRQELERIARGASRGRGRGERPAAAGPAAAPQVQLPLPPPVPAADADAAQRFEAFAAHERQRMLDELREAAEELGGPWPLPAGFDTQPLPGREPAFWHHAVRPAVDLLKGRPGLLHPPFPVIIMSSALVAPLPFRSFLRHPSFVITTRPRFSFPFFFFIVLFFVVVLVVLCPPPSSTVLCPPSS